MRLIFQLNLSSIDFSFVIQYNIVNCMKLVVCVLCVMATDRTATVSQINPNFVVVFFLCFVMWFSVHGGLSRFCCAVLWPNERVRTNGECYCITHHQIKTSINCIHIYFVFHFELLGSLA